MIGPEHYAEAERLVNSCMGEGIDGSTWVETDTAETLAAAQVHATLALATAVADFCQEVHEEIVRRIRRGEL